jgi:ribosomal protein S18 acetylase RimI-like enzyme
MRHTTLAMLSFQGIADAFNLVYTGYFVPSTVDEERARYHMEAGDIALDASPLWLDEAGAVVSLAALGVRGARGWVGGFGVAPAYRGQGISHALIGALLESARRIGLRDVALEVLVQNTPAIRAYTRAGFAHRRDLRTFRSEQPVAADNGNEVHPADPAALLSHRARIGVPPPWQREPGSLAKTPGLEGLACGISDDPRAFLIYRASDSAVTLIDIAAPDADAALQLVDALARRCPGRPMRLTNEPEESPVCAALDSLGWTEIIRQHEMVCPLPTPSPARNGRGALT